MKKRGLTSIAAGIVLCIVGIFMLGVPSSNYWGYSSSTRTIMEIAPFFFIVIGALGALVGVFDFIQAGKPLTKVQAKVIEKNGNTITLELADGTRKTLTAIGVTLVVGDEGIVGYKGLYIVEFNRNIN